jgi:hypothetical protein
MYPHPSGGGVLRLHSTFRHDLKIKASDEGRVMKTAAAFTKGMLELEGNLTPVLVSLVSVEEKNSQMLDHYGNSEIKTLMDACKAHIDRVMQVDKDLTPEMCGEIAPAKLLSIHESLAALGNPKQSLKSIHFYIGKLCEEIRTCCDTIRMREEAEAAAKAEAAVAAVELSRKGSVGVEVSEPSPSADHVDNSSQLESPLVRSVASSSVTEIAPRVNAGDSGDPAPALNSAAAEELAVGDASSSAAAAAGPTGTVTDERAVELGDAQPEDEEEIEPGLPELYLRETYDLMLVRWDKLFKDFYNKATDHYDLTKVPDVYDMVRYDILHNQFSCFHSLEPLYELARNFADTVVPQEYGIEIKQKRYIGTKMCHALLEKLLHDLKVAKSNSQMDMTYLLDMSHAEDLNIRSMGRCVRTRLYFTSESHLHTLLNVLRYPADGEPDVLSKEGQEVIAETPELSYLTHIVIRLFERRDREADDAQRFRCEISFSPGTTIDPRNDKSAFVTPAVVISNRTLVCDDLIKHLSAEIACSDAIGSVEVGLDVPPAAPLALSTPSRKSLTSGSVPPDSPASGWIQQHAQGSVTVASPDDCSDNWETETNKRDSSRTPPRKVKNKGKQSGKLYQTMSFHHPSGTNEKEAKLGSSYQLSPSKSDSNLINVTEQNIGITGDSVTIIPDALRADDDHPVVKTDSEPTKDIIKDYF